MSGTGPATGTRAWLTVLGATLAFFCSIGFVNAFGVFQAYYATNYLSDKSESNIGWIGSVNVFFVFFLAPVGGILVDKVGPRVLVGLGSLGQVIGMFMVSLCTKYYQFILAQAILMGISMSFVAWPAVGVVGRHLPHRRGLALGIVVGGSSIGGIIWPIMLDRMIGMQNLGFPWTIRIVGFTMLALLAIATATITEPRLVQEKTEATTESGTSSGSAVITKEAGESTDSSSTEIKPKQSIDTSVLRNKAFLLLCAGMAVAYLGMFGPFFFISTYATEYNYTSSSMSYLISILNAGSLFGRVLPGILADKYGHFNICALALFASAITAFCWTTVDNEAELIVFAVAYGFTSGALMSTQGACAGKIASRRAQGTAAGFLFGSVSLTALAGTPVCGQLVSEYGYLVLSMFCGATLIVGGILVTLARLSLDRRLFANI